MPNPVLSLAKVGSVDYSQTLCGCLWVAYVSNPEDMPHFRKCIKEASLRAYSSYEGHGLTIPITKC